MSFEPKTYVEVSNFNDVEYYESFYTKEDAEKFMFQINCMTPTTGLEAWIVDRYTMEVCIRKYGLKIGEEA